MGNSLDVHRDQENQFGKLKTTKEGGTLLNDFITDTFKNNYDTYWEDEGLPASSPTQKRARALSRYPFVTRACCTGSTHIPIELPYYDPIAKKVKSAYPLLKVLENENDPICGREVEGIKTNLKINKDDSTEYKDPFTSQGSSGQCTTFYSAEKANYGNKSAGFCDRVIDIRKKEFPNDKFEQLYGNQTDEKFYDGLTNKYIPETSNNLKTAYPDCNCLNSAALRLPQPEFPNNASKKNALAQTGDGYCSSQSDATNKYVDNISTAAINFCINTIDIGGDISASDAGKINIQQSCKTQVSGKPKPKPKSDSNINIKQGKSTGRVVTSKEQEDKLKANQQKIDDAIKAAKEAAAAAKAATERANKAQRELQKEKNLEKLNKRKEELAAAEKAKKEALAKAEETKQKAQQLKDESEKNKEKAKKEAQQKKLLELIEISGGSLIIGLVIMLAVL